MLAGLASSTIRILVHSVSKEESDLDSRRARELRGVLAKLRPNDADASHIARLRLRVLQSLAQSVSDAAAVLNALEGLDEGSQRRLRAMAYETLGREDTPAAWAAAGEPQKGLEFLRTRGLLRDGMVYANANGLDTPQELDCAIRLLDNLESYRSLSANLRPKERDAVEAAGRELFAQRGRK